MLHETAAHISEYHCTYQQGHFGKSYSLRDSCIGTIQSEITADTWIFLEKIFLDLNIGRHCPVECHVTDGQNAEDDLMDVIECTKVSISYFYITSIYCFPSNWFYSNGLQNAVCPFTVHFKEAQLFSTFTSFRMGT